MDDADRATRSEELIHQHNIAAVRRRNAELPAVGFCYYCSEQVPAGSRFCDADCMTGWQEEEDARRRNGKPTGLTRP